MSENELAACPACDSAAYIGTYEEQDGGGRYRDFFAGTCKSDECGFRTGTFETKAEAAAAWNRRVPAARPAWLTELIAAGEAWRSISEQKAIEYGMNGSFTAAGAAEEAKALRVLCQAARAIPQEDGK